MTTLFDFWVKIDYNIYCMTIPLSEKQKWQQWLIGHPTRAESILLAKMQGMEELRNKFEFQAIVEGFIVDFWFPAHRLAVEIDGNIHNTPEQIKKDQFRSGILRERGIKIIRIENRLIYADVRNAIFKIFNNLANRPIYKSTNRRIRKRGSFAQDHINRGAMRTFGMSNKARSHGARKKTKAQSCGRIPVREFVRT